MMEVEEKPLTISYETIDSIWRKILDNFHLDLDFNSNAYDDQISKQAKIVKDLIEKSPCITVHNKDLSVRLKSWTGYSVQAFDSMRLLAVDMMLKNRN